MADKSIHALFNIIDGNIEKVVPYWKPSFICGSTRKKKQMI